MSPTTAPVTGVPLASTTCIVTVSGARTRMSRSRLASTRIRVPDSTKNGPIGNA